jgi:hypothetical protein
MTTMTEVQSDITTTPAKKRERLKNGRHYKIIPKYLNKKTMDHFLYNLNPIFRSIQLSMMSSCLKLSKGESANLFISSMYFQDSY